MTPRQQTRRQFLRVGGTSLAVIGGSGLVATTTSAQTDSSNLPQGILSDGMGEGGDMWAVFRGFRSRYGLRGSPPKSATLADRARNEFNANSDQWIDYGNWLLEEHDVTVLGSATIAVDVSITRARTRWLSSGSTTETAIDVTFDDDTEMFTGLEWRLEEPEDPEYRVEVKNLAAESAADELQAFRREFIDVDDGHKLPDEEFVSELAGRYGASIGLGSDSRHVLELFLGGEVDGF